MELSSAKRVIIQAQKNFYVTDGVLYYENRDAAGRRRLVVPKDLRREVLTENHEALFAGHFAPKKMFKKLSLYHY